MKGLFVEKVGWDGCECRSTGFPIARSRERVGATTGPRAAVCLQFSGIDVAFVGMTNSDISKKSDTTYPRHEAHQAKGRQLRVFHHGEYCFRAKNCIVFQSFSIPSTRKLNKLQKTNLPESRRKAKDE